MKRGWYWPWIIVALLCFTAAFQGALIYAATHDPSMAIEPDYYRKAVAWDRQMAQDSVSRALGWRAAATVGAVGRDGAPVTLHIVDARGTPLAGARVVLTAINNVDGAHHIVGTLREEARGVYSARVSLDRPGLWEFRIDARRGTDRFTASFRADAAADEPRLPERATAR